MFFTNDALNQSYNVFANLMVLSLKNRNFAAVLLSQQDYVIESMDAKALPLQNFIEKYFSVTDFFNFDEQKAQLFADLNSMGLYQIPDWLDFDLFCNLSHVAYNIALNLESPNNPSIFFEKGDSRQMLFLISLQSSYFPDGANQTERALLTNFANSLTQERQINPNDPNDVMELINRNTCKNLLIKLISDFINLGSSKLISYDLILPVSRKYNQANKHLNENESIGQLELPRAFIHAINHAIVPLPQHLDANKVTQAIAYTLDSSCDCEYDCCGCVSESYFSTVKAGFIHIERRSNRNV